MPFYGANDSLGIVFQNSFDTIGDITNSAQALTILTENIMPKRPTITQENMRGIYEEGDSYLGQQEVTGEIEMEAHPIDMGYALKAFFGEAASVTQDTDVYTHLFSHVAPAFDDEKSFKQPFTFVKRIQDSDYVNYYNHVANSLEFSIANGELLKLKLSTLGGRDDGGSTSYTEAYALCDRFTWDACSVQLGSLNFMDYVKDITITCEEPVEPRYYLDGDVWPGKNVLTGKRKVTVAMSMHYENNSAYQYFLGKDQQGMDLTFEDNTLIQAGYYNKLRLQLRNVRLETAEANRGGPGEVLLNVTGTAFYEPSAGNPSNILAYLTNTKSAY